MAGDHFPLQRRCWWCGEQGAGSRGYVSEQTSIEAVVVTKESIRSVIVRAAKVGVAAVGDGSVSSVSRWHHCLLWYLGHC